MGKGMQLLSSQRTRAVHTAALLGSVCWGSAQSAVALQWIPGCMKYERRLEGDGVLAMFK